LWGIEGSWLWWWMGVFGEGMSSSWSSHPQHIPINQWTHQLLICDWHSVNNSHTEMQTCQCCHRPPLECIPCAVIPYDLSHCILGCCQPVELTAPLPGHHHTPRQRLISWLFSDCNCQIVRDCVWNSDNSIRFCSVVSSPDRHKSVCFLCHTQSYKTQPWDQPLSWQQMCVMVRRYTPEGKPYKAMTATHMIFVFSVMLQHRGQDQQPSTIYNSTLKSAFGSKPLMSGMPSSWGQVGCYWPTI